MAAEKKNRRAAVEALINEGIYTKQEIADAIGTTVANVSSQMTYLRWMGKFIITNESKQLFFCSEEQAEARAEEQRAKQKGKAASARTPEQQAEVTHKTLKRQQASLETWKAKVVTLTNELAEEPDDEALTELLAEANANALLLEIKIKRNAAKAAELPEYAAPITEPDGSEVTNDDDDDLL